MPSISINNITSNHTQNAIAIFETDFKSITSLGISLVTQCSWSHAAIRINGIWYDADETRGEFNVMDIESYSDRWCIIAEFDGDLTSWLKDILYKKYNWKGIFQFPFYFLTNRNTNHFYCFQAAWDAVWFSLYKERYTPSKVSGETLKHLINETMSTFIYRKGIE